MSGWTAAPLGLKISAAMSTRTLLVTSSFLGAALVGAQVSCGGEGACAACERPERGGALANPELTETSGVAASRRHADVFYAHNDSGDSSRFFAFSRSGADLGVYKVEGAQNIDWEDMAVGPCDAGSCVYVADTGDNALERLAVALYRVAEPDAVMPGEQALASERIVFTYPEGAQDAETLLVHPKTGAVTIVTKVDKGPATIYELPLPLTTGKTFMAVKKGEIEPPEGDNKFTGGSIHPDGTGILLRTHTDLFYYPMQPDQSAAEALIQQDGCALRVADETLGEAVTWLSDGAGLVTVGEGAAAQVNVSSCAL